MEEAIAICLSASGEQRAAAIRALIPDLKRLATSHPDEAARAVKRLALPDLDYSTLNMLARIRDGLGNAKTPTSPIKIAILATFTTHQLVSLMDLFLWASGIEAEIYQGDYGVLEQEVLDRTSKLHSFGPDILFIATTWRDLGPRPRFEDNREQIESLLAEEVGRWLSLWRAANGFFGCQVIQNNFESPPWRTLSNLEMRHPSGLGQFIARVNLALQEAAAPYVTIHDVDHLAAAAGRWAWSDERFYYHAKLPCAPEFLPEYAYSVSTLIGAHLGQAKKCLVLDVDNTLWGGVIGDDGLGGIRLGQGDAEGEAFQAFQHYVRNLAARGVILAICSKNDERIAREVFEKHPEMVLRLPDIACFVANWEDKASNLRRIARTLEIGLNSFVFVDDNPAERALVRQLVPEVAVPELPEDPAGYVQAIERQLYFQAISVGQEDLQRGAMYRANAQRQQAEQSSSNIDAFLLSLRMRARIEPVQAANIERVAQLIARSNQFNLTTRRHSAAVVREMADRSDALSLAVSLSDRFGDHGLISVLLAKRVAASEFVIDTWLMSCRVLKRGVEEHLRNFLCRTARERGVASIVGEYIPTAKNGLVRDHYAKLGFQLVSTDDHGHTFWRLTTADAEDLKTFISEADAHA
jgi:FkbH-like protein